MASNAEQQGCRRYTYRHLPQSSAKQQWKQGLIDPYARRLVHHTSLKSLQVKGGNLRATSAQTCARIVNFEVRFTSSPTRPSRPPAAKNNHCRCAEAGGAKAGAHVKKKRRGGFASQNIAYAMPGAKKVEQHFLSPREHTPTLQGGESLVA